MPKYLDQFGDGVRGLLSYNPGPGIYSRLERAIQDMPANVRVQELPGLLKRYKEGVPGWELRATDLDKTIAGRDVVSRDELLAAVRERSPVYTHREVVLGGTPQTESRWAMAGSDLPVNFPGTDEEKIAAGFVRRHSPIYQRESSPLGSGVSHGGAKYEGYGQGGKDYSELLLTQRPRLDSEYDNHWDEINSPSSAVRVAAEDGAVAHARFDTHGDALRINELQSDLGIHNRKAREATQQFVEGGGSPDYAPRQELPFPLEDAWAELLIKRLALEAARGGHRAIEIASPRAIADKVGGNIDNYEHFYGKVVPGALERLGRKMGGLIDDTPAHAGEVLRYELPYDGGNLVTEPRGVAEKIFRDEFPRTGPAPAFEIDPGQAYNSLEYSYSLNPERVGQNATILHAALAMRLKRAGMPMDQAYVVAGQRMPELMRLAEEQAARASAYDRVYELRDAQDQARKIKERLGTPGRRYIMSDTMRRNLIEKGVGASVLAPLLLQSED